MKVSVHIPRGKTGVRSFLLREQSQGRNIQDSATKDEVTRALGKLAREVDDLEEKVGRAIFSDGDEVVVKDYAGRRFSYHCGKKYEEIVLKPFHPNLLVVIDADEASIGTTNGEDIEVLWSETSFVMRKTDMGGQSKARFQRAREQELKHWLRKVAEKVKDMHGGREIIVGGPGMTKGKFISELPS